MVEIKSVRRETPEWKKIEYCFTHNFRVNVLHIERIQNQWLWKSYFRSRQDLSQKNNGQINEKWLFHGTKNTPPQKVYNSEQGFDNRLSSRGLWGEGAYFAERSGYSHNYAYTTPEGHKS